MSSNNKTTTKDEEKEIDEIDSLKSYILACPIPTIVSSKNCRAIQAAITGLDNERKRIERDIKLMKKFSTANTTTDTKTTEVTTTTTAATTTTSSSIIAPTHTTKNKAMDGDDDVMMDDDDDDDEWQDIAERNSDDSSNVIPEDDGSILGKELAQSSITSMSQAGVKVKTPLGAVALALHSALRGDLLNFTCTDSIPDIDEGKKKKKSGGGFAAPIRELQKTKFITDQWENNAKDANHSYEFVALRYRKDGVGSIILTVTIPRSKNVDNNDHINSVYVQLTPSNTKEPMNVDGLTFVLDEHVNLNSFTTALEKSGVDGNGILPALHYKQLPVLMTKFCNTFDLGAHDHHHQDTTPAAAAAHQVHVQQQQPSTSVPVPNGRVEGKEKLYYDPHQPPKIGDLHPHMPRGDFNGDLIGDFGGPTGIHSGTGQGGNLMGPNHPMFTGGDPSNIGGGLGGGMGGGMQPRFDPFGPPGGPTDPNFLDPNNPNGGSRGRGQVRPRPRPPPGGLGEPNPDHQRPPNDLSNNMFM